MTNPAEIKSAKFTRDDITIKLQNGVIISLTSNHSSIHVHFSGIGTNPIGTNSQAANQLNITYQPSRK